MVPAECRKGGRGEEMIGGRITVKLAELTEDDVLDMEAGFLIIFFQVVIRLISEGKNCFMKV